MKDLTIILRLFLPTVVLRRPFKLHFKHVRRVLLPKEMWYHFAVVIPETREEAVQTATVFSDRRVIFRTVSSQARFSLQKRIQILELPLLVLSLTTASPSLRLLIITSTILFMYCCIKKKKLLHCLSEHMSVIVDTTLEKNPAFL